MTGGRRDGSLRDRVDAVGGGLAVFALVVLVLLAYAGSTSSVAFSTYNGNWEGASGLESRASAVDATPTVVLDVREYETATPSGTVALVLSPERPYTEREVDTLRRFVASGGTLVVAEDFGPYANPLLAGVGASARVDGRLIRDDRAHAESASMPLVDSADNSSLVPAGLVFNFGTSVVPNGATVTATTSPFAYLDSDRDRTLDGSEPVGRHPVATVEQVGQGTVITVGDPSVFINSMLAYEANGAFVSGLFDRHTAVLLDQSHATSSPPLGRALVVLRGSLVAQLLLGTLGVAIIAVVGRWGVPGLATARRLTTSFRARVRGRRVAPTADPDGSREWQSSEAELVAYLSRQHPDWERERVVRVVRMVRSPSTEKR